MTGLHRYPQEYVAAVRAEDARVFLSATGLPERSSIFVAAEGTGHSVEGRELLQVSEVENDGSYAIDCDSGEILFWDGEIENLSYVNASAQQFGTSVTTFEEATAGSTMDEAEEISARLAVELAEIDPTALRDENGFWQSLLNDVLIGVYAKEEDEEE